MERHFEEELKNIEAMILRMAEEVEKMIFKSIESLKKRESGLAEDVFDCDAAIDEMELEIEDRCISFLTLFQPVASDMRFVVNCIKISAELERIADLAVNIAQRVVELGDEPLLKPLIDLPELSVVTRKMVRESIDALVKRDVELAKNVILYDSEADRLKNLIQDELIYDYMLKDGTTAPRAVPLLLIARHLERICDHATNICEDIIYMVEAKVVKHHQERL